MGYDEYIHKEVLPMLTRYNQNILKYFSKNPDQNALIHLLGGIGIGLFIAYPVAGIHPVRWGIFFISMAVVGYIWAGRQK
jgi:hypothetical protein